MTEELLEKAKEAQSPEELLTLMQENGMEDFTKEEAEELYKQMHMTGELTDEELENVTGGSHTTVGGQKYKVVSSATKCFNGKFESGFYTTQVSAGDPIHEHPLRQDHTSLRNMWKMFAYSDKNRCGYCLHLGFTKALTGYCEVEHDS